MTVFLSDQAKDLIRSNFFGKDFETITNELNDHLLLQFGAEVQSNVIASEFGQYLIEMHAFALSTAHWYGDRQADDTTLRFARLRAAANVIARQLGYKPAAAIAPAIDITILLDFAPTLTRLTIEAGRILVGPGGLFYITTEEVIFDIGVVGPKTVSAIEGVAVEEIFTSDGSPNQFFFLETVPPGKSISQDTPRVFVNTVEWIEQPLLTFERIDQFEVQYGFNPARLQFGDGIAGNVPPVDAEIRVEYVATSGPSGAVQANTVTAFQQPLQAGTQTITATVTHNEPSTTGSFREAIDSIRINAPLVTQTADRAVTQKDLDALTNAFVDPVFGAVAIGRATVPRTVEADAEAQTIIGLVTACGCTQDVIDRLTTYWDSVLSANCKANVVVAQILSEDSVGRYVSANVGLARSLETYLNARAESTVQVVVTDGSINLFSVTLTVEISLAAGFDNNTSRPIVTNNVISVLEGALLGRNYGESLRISDLYALVEAVEGVTFSHITISEINGAPPAAGVLNSFGDLVIRDFEVITLGDRPIVTTL